MSRYKSEQTVYDPLKKKYVPLCRLDTNTVIVTHFNPDTLIEESKTCLLSLSRPAETLSM